MTLDEILTELETIQENQEFPQEAVRAALEMREEITPFLLKSLDEAYENAQTYYDSGGNGNDLFVYAIYLLAQFREKKAFPKLVRLLTLSDELGDFILGDITTEAMDRALNCTFNGDFSLLKTVAEDESLDEFHRLAALDALFLLYRRGELLKSELLDYVTDFAENSIGSTDSLGGCLCVSIADNHFTELLPLIRELFDNGLVDEMIGGDYGDIVDIMFDYSKERSVRETIDDVEYELMRWGWFKKDTAKRSSKEFDRMFETRNNHGETIGPNDKCPCGSGKKYKKCCRDADEAVDRKLGDSRENSYENKLLIDYPKLTETSDGDRNFYEYYPKKAIELDIPVYKTLHHHAIPIWELPTEEFQTSIKISCLKEAYALFKTICAEENITDFASFNAKYMVHYRAEEWIEEFLKLLDDLSDVGIFTDKKMTDLFNDLLNTRNTMGQK